MVKLLEDFIGLRKAFGEIKEGIEINVRMNQLAEILFCTTKNAKLIISKMVEKRWITFTAGVGRGNISKLTFLVKEQDLIFYYAKESVHRGNIDEAFALVRKYEDDKRNENNETFIQILQNYFGFIIEKQEDDYIETLRFPTFIPIVTLDPAISFFTFNAHLIRQIYDTLVCLHPITKAPQPHLAHSWEKNDDGTEWTFYLRKGVLFHHGQELTAHDVEYTLQRFKNISNAQNWLVDHITQINVLHKYTIQMKLSGPNHLFLQYLSQSACSILPSTIDAKEESLEAIPIGTGPFRVIRKDPFHLFLEAFPQYHFGRAQIDRVEIIRASEDIQEVLEQRFNKVFVNTGETPKMQKDSWKVVNQTYIGTSLLTMNLSKDGPQRHMEFRYAMNIICDRKQMIDEIGEPTYSPANGFYLEEDKNLSKEKKDEMINELLKQIKYNGEPFQITVYERHKKHALWIKEQCLRYSVHVQVHIVPWADLLLADNIDCSDGILFEAVFSQGQVSFIELFLFQNSFVRRHLSEEIRLEIDNKIKEAIQCEDDLSRQKIFIEIEERIKSSLGVIFLIHKSVDVTFHPEVKGVQINSSGWLDFKNIWIKHI